MIPKKRDSLGELKSTGTGLDSLVLLEEEFSAHSVAFGNSGAKAIQLDPSIEETEIYEAFRSQSPRLPGTLEIDHISRYITEKDGYCLSQSAQWFAVIAVRDYLTKILRKTMDCYDEKETANGKMPKRRRISNYDFVQVMDDSQPNVLGNSPIIPSRMAWEHFASKSCTAVPNGSNPKLQEFQSTINNFIDFATFNRQMDPIGQRQQSDSVGGGGGGKQGKDGGKQGKDLSAMMARQSNTAKNRPFFNTPAERDLKAMLNEEAGMVSTTSQKPNYERQTSFLSQFGEMSTTGELTEWELDASHDSISRRSSLASFNPSRKMHGDVSEKQVNLSFAGDHSATNALHDSMSRRSSLASSFNASSKMHGDVSEKQVNLSFPAGDNSAPTSTSQFGMLLSRPNSTATTPWSQGEAISRPSTASMQTEPARIGTAGSDEPTSRPAFSKRPASASSTNTSVGGRGRGSKDLSAMLKRNKSK